MNAADEFLAREEVVPGLRRRCLEAGRVICFNRAIEVAEALYVVHAVEPGAAKRYLSAELPPPYEDESLFEYRYRIGLSSIDAPYTRALYWRNGDWRNVRELRPGAIFETRDGIRAVKTEYHIGYNKIECILLASGEFAHFDLAPEKHNATPVREIKLAP